MMDYNNILYKLEEMSLEVKRIEYYSDMEQLVLHFENGLNLIVIQRGKNMTAMMRRYIMDIHWPKKHKQSNVWPIDTNRTIVLMSLDEMLYNLKKIVR